MEFKEFNNPEEKDYDINSSLNGDKNNVNNVSFNPYTEELINLIGFLDDVTEEDLIENYGIRMNEYLCPNAETINKVTEKLNSYNNRRSR